MEQGRGGHTDVAAALTRHYNLRPPMNRQQVESWARRRTRNAAGHPFPAPAEYAPRRVTHRPWALYDFEQVIRWTEPGVPNPHNRPGFRKLGE